MSAFVCSDYHPRPEAEVRRCLWCGQPLSASEAGALDNDGGLLQLCRACLADYNALSPCPTCPDRDCGYCREVV